jgi:hypothetical protein
MESGSRTLSFFRVFDLAFFAPGFVQVSTFLWLQRKSLAQINVELTSFFGFVAVIFLLASVFVVGLMIHSLTWFIRGVFTKAFPEQLLHRTKRDSAFPSRFSQPIAEDLILYFWYLRSTCWNLSTALILALGFLFWQESLPPSVVVGLIFGAALLWMQGRDYSRLIDQFYRESTTRKVK